MGIDSSRTHLNFKREIFLEIFDDHHEIWQFDAERFLRIGGTGDECGGDIRRDDLEHERLDVVVCDPFDVSISHLEIFAMKIIFPGSSN